MSELKITADGMVSFSCQTSAHHSLRERYRVQVFGSPDNFTNPLPLSLDLLAPGDVMAISFDGNEIIGDFDGFLSLEVRLTPVVFPVMVHSKKNKFSRKGKVHLRWNDHFESGWYNVEIYKDSILAERMVGNYRGNSLVAKLPKGLKKGSYALLVTPSNNPDNRSDNFPITIKSSKSGMIAGLTGLIVGGAGVVLFRDGKPGSGGGEGLPGPPGLPGIWNK